MAGCPGEKWFEQYEAGGLSPEQKARFESHLRECRACAARQAARRQAEQALLADLKQIDPFSLGEGKPLNHAEAELNSPRGTQRLSQDERLDARAPDRDSSLPLLMIEGFEILREVHRGGQGIVYQAIQNQTKRKVAVKVLLEGAHASPSAKRRFEREIELVAQLKHANIVAVFHAGSTADGRQFCVMDYVHGRPLDRHVREKRLALEDILPLFATICDAVTYAHQRGIIHRDLKPSNILVDADGSPRVLDFGMARQLAAPAETLASMTGQVFGTLPYMSPEQAGGNPAEVDTRSDVYALGVILYQLLTGRFPYPVEGQIPEVLRHISETPPTPPSRSWSMDSGVARRSARQAVPLGCPIDDEVQTIVMKALVKERERRYQSAADFARDIRHYLAGEPIEAKRDSSWYVLKKTIRRYKAPVSLAAALFVVALGAAIGLSIMYRAKARLLVQVEEQRETAVKAQAEAERQAGTAMAINQFLQDMLAAPSPFAEKPSAELAREVKVADVLDTAAAKVEKTLAGKPEIESAVRTTLGTTYTDLGLFDKGYRELSRAVELRERALGPEHPDTLASLFSLSMCLAEKGDFEEAERVGRQVVEARRRNLGADHPDTLAALNNLGRCMHLKGDYAQAEEVLRPALDAHRRILGEEHHMTQLCMNNLACAVHLQGRVDEAEEWYRRLLEIQARVLTDGHPDTIETLNNLAMLLQGENRQAEAETLFQRAVEAARKVLGDEHRLTMGATGNLALCRYGQGDRAGAEAVWRSLWPVQKRILGEDHPDTLLTSNNLAACAFEKGNYSEAEKYFRSALTAQKRIMGEDHPETLKTLANLASVVGGLGRVDEAMELHRQALDGLRRTLGENHPATLLTRQHIARNLQQQGKLEEAETIFRQTLESAENAAHVDKVTLAVIKGNYGGCLLKMKRYADAEEPLLACYEALTAVFGPRHAYSQRTASTIVDLYDAWDKPEKAAEWRDKLEPTVEPPPANDQDE